MQLQRKKELWRYSSQNRAAAADGTTNQQPQPPHHPLRHRLQSADRQQQHICPSQQVTCDNHCCNTNNSSAVSISETCNIPSPTYSAMSCGISCNASVTQQQQQQQEMRQQCSTDAETDTTASAAESEASNEDVSIFKRTCRSCENSGGDTIGRMPAHNKSRSNRNSSSKCRAFCNPQNRNLRSSPTDQSLNSLDSPSLTTTLYATAVNIFRCCNFLSDSTTGTTMNNNISIRPGYDHHEQTTATSKADDLWHLEVFNSLMKLLKRDQQEALLTAVKSRYVPNAPHHPQCILVPPTSVANELPHVVTYRLFFWWNLINATELKRLPTCPSEYDPKYICCNPLHWCRVIETDSAPPPYRRLEMERLRSKDEISDYAGDSTTASVGSCNSTSSRKDIMRTDYVQIPESFTTVGEDCRWWCKVAYWEMSERVGSLYSAEKPTISIYADGSCSGGFCEEMSLKELAEKKSTPVPFNVKQTREKIGLGVVLRQEDDGVWLYNRSIIPIFINSPTLGDSLSYVYKVQPGDCLKAFDSHRAQSLMDSAQLLSAELGPIDMYSMCISFLKGWGENYRRQNIHGCPCWVQVLFAHR